MARRLLSVGGIASLLPVLAACGAAIAGAPSAGVVAAADGGGAETIRREGVSDARARIVDELGYLEELKAKRPDLYANADDCYDSLVLRPAYRAELLAGKDTFDTLRRKHATAEDVAADAKWTASLQAATVQHCQANLGVGGCSRICRNACAACPPTSLGTGADVTPSVRPAPYPLCSFVGYTVNLGPSGTPYDTSGQVRSWKAFFELGTSFHTGLTAERYLELSRRLAAAGFRGDSKIPLGEGQVRFQYNGIIVHGHSPKDVMIAERVVFELLGAAVTAHGRGLDLNVATSPNGALDWHSYLCAEGPGKLSPEALAFVRFKD